MGVEAIRMSFTRWGAQAVRQSVDYLIPESVAEGDVQPSIEGVVKGLALSQLWNAFPPLQGALTYALYELNRNAPESLLHPAIIAATAASLIAGAAIELDTLKKKGYTANPGTTFLYMKLKRPVPAVILSTLWTNVHGLAFNAADIISFSIGGSVAFANLESRMAVGLAYQGFMGWAVQSGRADEVVEKMAWVAEKSGFNAADRWLVPAKEVYYPDNPKPKSPPFPSEAQLYLYRR